MLYEYARSLMLLNAEIKRHRPSPKTMETNMTRCALAHSRDTVSATANNDSDNTFLINSEQT